MSHSASPRAYHHDAFDTLSDQDSDPEDDQLIHHAKNSFELAEHDRGVLHEEEEREKLLTGEASHMSQPERQHPGENAESSRKERRRRRRLSRKARRQKNRAGNDEEDKLMYEMEEGGRGDDTSSQSSFSSIDLDKRNFDNMSMSRRTKTLHRIIIPAIIIIFSILALGAYLSSRRNLHPKPIVSTLSNGSSIFAPTTILISLDGFRADFLNRNLTPTLNSFIAKGVSPKYMLPSFPSVTFPNHYTLVTGLYPESHGVVGNTFWDPALKEEFYYTDPTRSMQPKWWAGGEPVWVTAEKENVSTAIHMWPGSEAHIQLEPTFLDKFNGSEVLSRKVDRILEFIDLPSKQDTEQSSAEPHRPQFIAAYVPVVDADGHKYGPNSTQIRNTISNVDTMLHDLFTGLEQRNLSEVVNIIVVSDHGMATTSTDRLIQLDDLIDLNLIEHIDGWPLYGLRPKDLNDLGSLYSQLLAESEQNPNVEVRLRENMPDRYHFSKNDRIAPLWIIPKTGWAIVQKKNLEVEKAKMNGEIYHPRGLHGYDHEHPLMRAIFVARGPAFPHKPNSKVEVFQNIEVYNIVCDSLGIEPKPNNGSLRLPLVPIGLHSDESKLLEDIPMDLPSEIEDISTSESLTTPMSSSGAIQNSTPTTRPKENESEVPNDDEENKEKLSEWWTYFIERVKAAKAWAASMIPKAKGNKDESKQDTKA